MSKNAWINFISTCLCTDLQTLVTNSVWQPNSFMAAACKFSHLRKLEISLESTLDDELLETISECCPCLESLHLPDTEELWEEGLKVSSQWQNTAG